MRTLLIFMLVVSSVANARDVFEEPTVEDIPALIETLSDPNLRRGASDALVRLGRPAVSRLVASVGSADVNVRIWSTYSLGKIGPDARTATTALVKLLSDPDENVRAAAAKSLGLIQATDAKVIEALANGLTDRNPRVRARCAVSLGQFGAEAESSVGRLVMSLSDQVIRKQVMNALQKIGKSATATLVGALTDDKIRLDAAETVRRIDMDSARKAGVDKTTSADLNSLRISINNQDRAVLARVDSVYQVATLGEPAVVVLISAFEDKSDTVSRAASAAFAKNNGVGVTALQTALKHKSARTRAAAADALGVVGPHAKPAIKDLAVTLKDPDRNVRHRVAVALGKLGTTAAPAVSSLIEVMDNPRDAEPTRQMALKALLTTGPKTRDQVIPALKKATNDSNYGIKSLALVVLRQLEPKAKSK
jgi:HEAT repeat protein